MIVIHFHNGKEGGVFSVMKNLLNFQQSPYIENHIIYTINKDEFHDFQIPIIPNTKSQKVFYYSSNWNFYYTCKKLARLLPNENAVIVANDWIELGMVSNLGLSNPVIQILHGDYNYYYNLATIHNKNINFMFCVSPVISKKLKLKLNPEKVCDWRFPIPNSDDVIKSRKNICMAFFAGNILDPNKNYRILPIIDKILVNKKIEINWFIAGGGINKEEIDSFWNENTQSRVNHYGLLNEFQINDFLLNCNTMILPSREEGLPVSVVEAMKKGIVPFVSYWNGAVSEIVIEGETGFYADFSNSQEYADKIELFYLNKELREQMSVSAKVKADNIFNPVISVQIFENIALSLKSNKVKKNRVYCSRLDRKLIPNFLVRFIRSII